MRGVRGILLFVAATAGLASGQQTTPSAPFLLAGNQLERVKVYSVGPGVTAPQLLPLNLPPILGGKCKRKVDGEVVLSVFVDSTGRPRNLMFLKPLGNALDKFALQVASADRFNPGTHDGVPVAIGQSLKVGLQACVEQKKDDSGNKTFLYRLRSQPTQEFYPLADPSDDTVFAPDNWSWGNPNGSADQTVNFGGTNQVKSLGGSVKAPVLVKHVGAVYTDAARKARLQGSCTISIVVDRNGLPQNLRVTKSLEYGLDHNAIESISQFRFKPAMKEGEPVPAMIDVEISYHLY